MQQTDLSDYGGQGPEVELRRRLGEHDFLVDLMQLGHEMQEFIETPAGSYLFSTLKSDVNGGIKSLLGEPFMDTPAAQAAWARAKTAWASLALIQETLAMGRVSESMISEMDQVTP